MSFSFAEKSSPGKSNYLGNKAHTNHRQSTDRKQTSSLPALPRKKSRVTAAFQGGAFFPFPPGSNCLFCSLGVLRLRFSGVAAVEEVSANVFVSSYSVVEGILPPWLESTPAVKKPLAVVRPCSHIPSFGGHCSPGVPKSVPAYDDLSSSRSGSILPSSFFKLTHTSDEGSGSSG